MYEHHVTSSSGVHHSDHGIVIVGGGLAAARTAEQLRRSEFSGRITIVSDEAHLPYDRPPLSKQALSGQVLSPAGGRARLFAEWRQALGLDEVTEIPAAGGTPVYLHARGACGGVAVSIAATVLDDGGDSW